MIQQIFNTSTDGIVGTRTFDLSSYDGTVYTAQASGSAAQTVNIDGSNDGVNWKTITTLTIGAKETDVWAASWRFLRVDRTGGAHAVLTLG